MSSVYSLSFSPTRSVSTNYTEDTTPARALFHEDNMDMGVQSKASVNGIPNKNKSIPLSTITNNVNHKAHFTISTSPPPSVTELKERLKKKVEAAAAVQEKKKASFVRPPMQQTKENDSTAPRLPTHSTPHPSKRFKDSFKENDSVADTVPPSPSISRTVSIPMNKVNEMKKYLQLDFETTNRMKDVQMSSKKRAKIEERLNQVADIQDWLSTLERRQNKDGTNQGQNAKKELVLPANRVKEMKSWLIDFEQQRKAHADFYDTGSKSMKDNGRSHIPRIGFRYQPFEAREKTEGDLTRAEVDTSELPHVSELKQVLIDFEAKNKAHFDKHNTRPSFEYKAWRNSHGKATVQDENESESVMVTNTSFLDHEEENESSCQKDLNMSMMPVIGNSDDNVWGNDDLTVDSSYHEINVEPVESAETWVEENDEELSIDESNFDEDFAEEQVQDYDNEELSVDESEVVQETSPVVPSPTAMFNSTTFDSLYNKSLSTASADESVLSVDVEADQEDSDESSTKLELSDDEDADTFAVIETQHFDEYSPNHDYEDHSDDEDSDESTHQEEATAGLFGEKFVVAPVVTMAENDEIIRHSDKAAQMNKNFNHKIIKKKHLQKFLNVIKKMLASLKPKTKSNAVVLIEEQNANYTHGKTRENFKSSQVRKGQRYSFSTMYDLQSRDFVNQIALRSTEDVRKVVNHIALRHSEDVRRFGDSPGSLASAFRRSLSPSSSGVSGFTDVEALALRQYANVGEHVGFLKQTFKAQSPYGKKSEC